MDMSDEIREMKKRIEVLETAVFKAERGIGSGKQVGPSRTINGPSGGIRALVVEGFFSTRRSLRDVRGALAERGYMYSGQAVDMALTRESRRDGGLVALKERGRKIYVARM
jgi:hypothetical protein